MFGKKKILIYNKKEEKEENARKREIKRLEKEKELMKGEAVCFCCTLIRFFILILRRI